jgi:hypothetical protein
LDKIGGACGTYEIKMSDRVSVGKPDRKGPLERLRRRWEDDIKMNLRGRGDD